MRKAGYVLLFLLIAVIPVNVFGAGIYQNQNQSAEFIRTGNRNASTEPDAVYFNPAATAFLKDGIYIYFSNQYITDSREVRNSSKAIQTFVSYPEYQKYDGEASTLLYPDLHMIYKKNDVAAFCSFSIVGAGASATFNDGLPMFDTLALGYIAAMAGGFTDIVDYKTDIYMEGLQAMLGFTVGGAYKINDYVSVAGGVRFVYFMQEALVTLRWLSVQTITAPNDRLAGPQGAEDFHDMFIDMSAAGNSWSLIAGVHVKPMKNMDIGMKFEYHTVLRVTNDTKIMHVPAALEQIEDVKIGLDSYRDGATSNKTMPMVATIGVSYLFFSKLRTEVNFTYFFNKATNWGTDAYGEDIAGKFENGYDVGMALEYKIISNLKASTGFTYSVSGRTEESTNDADMGLDAVTVCLGASYSFTDNLQLTISGMRVFFKNLSINNDLSRVPDSNKAWLSGKTHLKETTWIAAFGITYRLPLDDETNTLPGSKGNGKIEINGI